jgi:ABC-type sugar transport system ATPase subunit
MNFLRVHTDGTSIAFATHRPLLPEPVAGSLTRKDGEMILGLRPEHFSVTSSSEDGPTVPATGSHTEQLGSEALVRLEDVPAETLGADSEAELAGAFVARLDSTVRTGRGQQLKLAVDVTRAHFFDLEDDRSLWSPS